MLILKFLTDLRSTVKNDEPRESLDNEMDSDVSVEKVPFMVNEHCEVIMDRECVLGQTGQVPGVTGVIG